MQPDLQHHVIPPHIILMIDKIKAGDVTATSSEIAMQVSEMVRELKVEDASEVLGFVMRKVFPDPLRVDLTTNVVERYGVRLELQPQPCELLHYMHEHYPSVVSIDALSKAVWGVKHHDRAGNTMRVMISRLRAKLKVLNVNIITQHRKGYRLELVHTPGAI